MCASARAESVLAPGTLDQAYLGIDGGLNVEVREERKGAELEFRERRGRGSWGCWCGRSGAGSGVKRRSEGKVASRRGAGGGGSGGAKRLHEGRGDVDKSFGVGVEGKAASFQGGGDGSARVQRHEDIVGKVGCNEEDGTVEVVGEWRGGERRVRDHLHAVHCERAAEFEHALPSIQAFSVDLNTDELLGTDDDLFALRGGE